VFGSSCDCRVSMIILVRRFGGTHVIMEEDIKQSALATYLFSKNKILFRLTILSENGADPSWSQVFTVTHMCMCAFI